VKDALLIVDNDDTITRCLELLLRDTYTVVTASSGNEALGILKNTKIECIISDYDMEDGNGLDFIRKLEKREIPFILMTGRGEKDLFKTFANERAFHIYEKPILTNIKEVIKDALQTYHEHQKRLKESLIGKSAGHIIHDLNNGLAIIEGSAHAGLIRASPDSSKFFNMTLSACKKITNMVSKYKKFMNGEEGIQLTSVGVEGFVREIIQECFQAYGKEISFSFENTIAPDTVILADVDLLRQVILNLISNAVHEIKNLRSPGISLKIHRNEKFTVIDVKDSGSIPNSVASNLFKEGFSTKKGGGTGMGLCYCKDFLQKMNADICLSNQNPTTFSIKFENQ